MTKIKKLITMQLTGNLLRVKMGLNRHNTTLPNEYCLANQQKDYCQGWNQISI